jgi:hypothetical protein
MKLVNTKKKGALRILQEFFSYSQKIWDEDARLDLVICEGWECRECADCVECDDVLDEDDGACVVRWCPKFGEEFDIKEK